jgi:hypothetical protein
MSQTGVLPFVRGIDFTKYNFDNDEKHPKLFSEMQRLRWLRINNTSMEKLPKDIRMLKKLVRKKNLKNIPVAENFF